MTTSRSDRPLRRRLAVNRVRICARDCGAADEAGVLTEMAMGFLRHFRREAAAAGCLPGDIDDATMIGLEEGRASHG